MHKFTKPLIETFVVLVAIVLISIIALKYYAPDTLYAEIETTVRDFNKRVESFVFSTTVNDDDPALKKGQIPDIIASNVAVFKFKEITSEPQEGRIERTKFADFIRKIKELGYETISYTEYRTAVEQKKKLPANSVVLIFSGKKEETYDIIEPILNGVGYKATLTYRGDPDINLERSVFISKESVDGLLSTGDWEYVPDAIPNVAFHSTNSVNELVSKINTSLNGNVTLAQNLDIINSGSNSVLARVLGESVTVDRTDEENALETVDYIEQDQDQGNESNDNSAQSSPAKPISTESKSIPDIYTVKQGDSLWKIAQNFYGSGFKAFDIARTNNISSPNLIYVGLRLVLPD